MRVELGKVLKPQGIKGELKVLPLSKPEFLLEAKEITLDNKPARITKCSIREGYAYIMLDICSDRNTAETLRDAIVSADSENLSELEQGEYYFEDLIGCKVYNEKGEDLGEVIEVENYGTADIITIHKGFSNIACPFLNDVFVDVDIKSKKIVVDSARFLEVTDYED